MNKTLVTIMPKAGGVIQFVSSLSVETVVKLATAETKSAVLPSIRLLSAVLALGKAEPFQGLPSAGAVQQLVRIPQIVLCEGLKSMVVVAEDSTETLAIP